MAPRLLFEALPVWTDPNTSPRQPNPFRSKWNPSKHLLLAEADHIGASEVVVGVVCRSSDLLASGEGLKAGRKVEHPGVVVTLVGTRHGDLRYACDTFSGRYYEDPEDWQINVRAVALGLEALRKVERYGIAGRGEQYAGWKALGSGIAMSAIPEPMSLDEAARLLADAMEVDHLAVLADSTIAKRAYRAAIKLLHPDHGGSGDGERMSRLNEAWRLLQHHHGEAA